MYTQFYGLRALPFRLTPDSRFFYPSQMHKGALAYLTYGLQKSEGFVLITGDGVPARPCSWTTCCR
jgi:general secretion pathway protein A